ncbi:helix-turn-helix domain-containing protein [Oscillatoria sp. FACHB-1407]|uniref:helix-turn-helix domain-containing protein n=1 Tax=Oscillatoria sp. FACHB-1407 TaxID=2692847 RepID=UPI001F54B881|nr:response regulator transcription factor [Oscillatoria sp. FACHB-1407]
MLDELHDIKSLPIHYEDNTHFELYLKSSYPKTISILAIDSDYQGYLQSHPLTKRELDVLRLIVEGYSNHAIAQKLYLSIGTIKTHVRNIPTKFNVHDRTHAAVAALRAGLVS